MIAVPLVSGCTLRVFPQERRTEVRFADGKTVAGTREATPENVAEAASQGYAADADGCWRSLVEHEALHVLCSADIWPDKLSAALRHEAGDARPYWARLHEEAVCLAFQAWSNGATDGVPVPLKPYRGFIVPWRAALLGVRDAVGLA